MHPKLPATLYYPANATNAKDALATLTHWRANDNQTVIYQLELHNRPDNRLTPALVDGAILPALNDVERAWRADRAGELIDGPGTGQAALITCGAIDAHRFYSNGLNLEDGPANLRGWFRYSFHHMLERFLTFPIPTIAAVNGHAFAGGFTLALSHDYRILKNAEGKGGKAMLCLNEVHFGAPLPAGMCAVARAKSTPRVFHKICVEGHRFLGEEALTAELVNELASSGDEVMAKAIKQAERVGPLAQAGCMGEIKKEMYKEAISNLALDVNHYIVPKREYQPDRRLGPPPERLAKL